MKITSSARALVFLAALGLFLGLGQNCRAEHGNEVHTPQHLAGGKIISPEEAKILADNKTAVFFDLRSAINYGKGHVPGAIALPYREKSAKSADFDADQDHFDLSRLPEDKHQTLVFYSHGHTGWKSYKAAVLAIRAGFTDVLWMREGLAGWLAKGYPEEF